VLRECHPERCFRALNGKQAMQYNKLSALPLYNGTIYSMLLAPYPEILPDVGEYKTFGE